MNFECSVVRSVQWQVVMVIKIPSVEIDKRKKNAQKELAFFHLPKLY